jgi:DNA mismatch repair protein MutL
LVPIRPHSDLYAENQYSEPKTGYDIKTEHHEITGARFEASANSACAVTGYVGRPSIARANRGFQLTYVNGRLIKNRAVYSAIDEAYKSYLPVKRHPVTILYITLDASLVDVNAHPAKTEVRFQSESDLFRAVFRAVESALRTMDTVAFTNQPRTPIISEKDDIGTFLGGDRADANEKRNESGQPAATLSKYARIAAAAQLTKYDRPSAATRLTSYVESAAPQPSEPAMHERSASAAESASLSSPSEIEMRQNMHIAADSHTASGTPPVSAPIGQVVYPHTGTDSVRGDSEAAQHAVPVQEQIFSTIERVPEHGIQELRVPGDSAAKYVGQLFGVYLIFEHGDVVSLVDQHAAHERMIFERLKTQFENMSVSRQLLLESVTVELLPDEMLFARDNASFFSRAGFYYEEFGIEAIVLREVPMYSERTDMREFFLETLEAAMNDPTAGARKAGMRAAPDALLYAIACKAAVKGNRRLSEREARDLYRALGSLPKPLTCPHGRPLVVTMAKREFDKKFLRV